ALVEQAGHTAQASHHSARTTHLRAGVCRNWRPFRPPLRVRWLPPKRLTSRRPFSRLACSPCSSTSSQFTPTVFPTPPFIGTTRITGLAGLPALPGDKVEE